MFEYQNPKYLSKVAQREEVSRKIFSERKLILSRSQKTLRSAKRKEKELKVADFRAIQKEIKRVLEHPVAENPKEKTKPSSMFTSVPREAAVSCKDSPGVGSYDINYKSIQKHISIPKILRIKKKTPKKPSNPCCKRKHSEEEVYRKSAIKAPSFAKQLPRFTPSTQDSQLSVLNYEIIPKHVYTPNLDKQLPRTDIFEGKGGPEYDPDKEKILKKISVNFDFAKTQGRIYKASTPETLFPIHPQSFVKGHASNRQKFHLLL